MTFMQGKSPPKRVTIVSRESVDETGDCGID
jgi:hypothetical protein